MSTSSDEPLRVLRFWRDLEIFNIPDAPSSRDSSDQTKISTLRHGKALPWRHADYQPTDQVGYVHVVYIGVADTADLLQLMLRGLFPEQDLSERESQRVRGNGWLAAFVVDEGGHPKHDSYLPASFAHGVAALREAGALENINARLERAKEEFAQRRHQITDDQEGEGNSAETETTALPCVDWAELDEELDVVRGLLGGVTHDQDMDWRVVVRSSRVKRRFLDANLQAATDFLNSFYLDDLDRLIAQAESKRPFGAALAAYLGPELDEQQRVDILADNVAMGRLVAAKRLLSARWPASSKKPLALAQQAAVAEVVQSLCSTEGLVGINGPPGTGKTTLLCDVIAEVVTERARRIAALDRPVDLFDAKMTVAGKGFFPLKADVVADTSIVVASTNNNAVKNITQELPACKKVSDEFGQLDYFGDVIREVFRAQRVVDEEGQPIETWGVIAAALGNAGNRRSFAQGFFRDEFVAPRQPEGPQAQIEERDAGVDSPDDEFGAQIGGDNRPPSMRQILEVACELYPQHQEDWRQAKKRFQELQAELDRCREKLVRAERAAQRIDAEEVRLERLDAEVLALERDIHDRELTLLKLQEAQYSQKAAVEGARLVVTQLRDCTQPSLWDRLMALLGRETHRLAVLRRSLAGPTQALAEASAALVETLGLMATARTALEQRCEQQKRLSVQLSALKQEIEAHRKELQAGYATGTKHFPNAKFWNLSTESRHRASVAVSPGFDALRAKLFLQAIELHRLTVLANATKFIANLRAVNGMLTGGSRDKLSPEHRPLLWNAFFFVVPVVSSTLASFDRLFAGMGQGSLGWLLIDEAGQATPQSVAGAIWRSRRAVVVGDPLQIEPVFTVPRSLADELMRRHDVASHWSPIEESAQTLSDRITKFGSWVETASSSLRPDAPGRLWTGMPLRTHRRCDDPMFSVANSIAYAGQMVQGRVDGTGQPTPWKFVCSLGESTWFDVRSTRVRHPVSDDELDFLTDCLLHLQHDKIAATKVFVISPFRKIAQACRKRIQGSGYGVDCGTVHTFQGKEANVVFLLLGTAPGQAGAGARSWASSSPNLLNVAITRAQCRLYVIGDTSQWGGLNYFRELHSALRVRSAAQRSPHLT